MHPPSRQRTPHSFARSGALSALVELARRRRPAQSDTSVIGRLPSPNVFAHGRSDSNPIVGSVPKECPFHQAQPSAKPTPSSQSPWRPRSDSPRAPIHRTRRDPDVRHVARVRRTGPPAAPSPRAPRPIALVAARFFHRADEVARSEVRPSPVDGAPRMTLENVRRRDRDPSSLSKEDEILRRR